MFVVANQYQLLKAFKHASQNCVLQSLSCLFDEKSTRFNCSIETSVHRDSCRRASDQFYLEVANQFDVLLPFGDPKILRDAAIQLYVCSELFLDLL